MPTTTATKEMKSFIAMGPMSRARAKNTSSRH